jgi:hypothetical protein
LSRSTIIALELRAAPPSNRGMINIKTAFGLVAAASLALTGFTLGADEKTYRAVGTLLRISDNMLLLRSAAQDIEFTRDAKTKVSGPLTKGATVTVSYTKVAGAPYATEVTAGSGAAAQPSKGQKKP